MTPKIKEHLNTALLYLRIVKNEIEEAEKLGYKQRDLAWNIHCLIDSIEERMESFKD